MNSKKFYEELSNRLSKYSEFIILVVTGVKGSVPRKIGAKMVVFPDGTILGTIGGGSLEEAALKDAKVVFIDKKSISRTYELIESGTGASCGGSAEVFIDYNNTKCGNLVVFGGGHIGYHLARFASELGFNVTIADPREEFIDRDRFPQADKLVKINMENLDLKDIIKPDSYVVLVSHSHDVDFQIVKVLLKLNPIYIGMIGSKRKVKTTFEKLLQEGFKKEDFSKVYAPIGLDIGAESPSEISLAIIAEVIAVRSNKQQPTFCKKNIAELM
jgi:xanthine dehydrogenase accessory factor